MPRSIVLGNGSLLATFDEHLQMKDFYFPHVGQEDHTAYGKCHRLGFFAEGKGFSWVSDGSWVIEPGYMESSLVSSSKMRCDKLALEIVSEDLVDPTRNCLMRSFKLRTTDGATRKVQCFFHHDFYLYGDKQKDTAFYEPHTKSVIHFREKRYFLVGGTTSDPVSCAPVNIDDEFHPLSNREKHIDHCGIASFAVGKSNYRGLEGTWRDAEDGVLSRAAIEQGSVDSTIEIDCMVAPNRDTTVYMWVCAGKRITDVHDLQHFILEETPEQVKASARNYWRGWVHSNADPGEDIPEDIRQQYWRSLLTIRTQIDNQGGIVAANDSDIMQFNRDTYTYVWPRDGSFVSMALTAAGEHEAVYRFLKFCEHIQSSDGYFLHKYNPDGSPGSSWHPWYKNGKSLLPVQLDETALPLLALWKHFEACQDFEFLHGMYHTLVKRAAGFLLKYRESKSGLPLPSYDLWEEHRGVFSYTTATICAGLRAAANISAALGHHRHAQVYGEGADDLTELLVYHLYDEETQCFLKNIVRDHEQTVERNTTPDASLALLWQFGVLPPDDPRIASTIRRLREKLTVKTPIGGLSRYTNDFYQSVTHPTADVPGNPWIITTLWIAQWQIAVAKELEDLREPLATLRWAKERASKAGMLPEQYNPFTGAPLSVSPLTWSHAVYVETVLQYTRKRQEILRRRERSLRA